MKSFDTETNLDPELLARAARIRLLLCDVDGILTDAAVFIGAAGLEFKRFNIRDGLGITQWRRAGYKIGWISARPSSATATRAAELKIDFVIQQRESKVKVIENLLRSNVYAWDEVCFMGDDIVDLGALRLAGLAVTVPQAVGAARRQAHYVTRHAGGEGAVREVIELLLRAQGRWDKIVAEASA
jgi:3-deoxy-D-manno-octulosonate 8-phosphate phosphatase (KDO 8-P phosphatase)